MYPTKEGKEENEIKKRAFHRFDREEETPDDFLVTQWRKKKREGRALKKGVILYD